MIIFFLNILKKNLLKNNNKLLEMNNKENVCNMCNYVFSVNVEIVN